MQKGKEKHDFYTLFLHKCRVLVGRGGFEPRGVFATLYFKGIQSLVPSLSHIILYNKNNFGGPLEYLKIAQI